MSDDSWDFVTILPSDYSDYGGNAVRWNDPDQSYPDCSCGCKWFARIDEDWGNCTKPGGAREGLLTHEHQAGFLCFEY